MAVSTERVSEMPSPVGHVLAGAAVYLAGTNRGERSRITLGVTLFGSIVPDFDFLPGILIGDPGAFHHGVSHSFAFAALLGLAVLVAFQRCLEKVIAAQAAVLTALAYASHVILDLINVSLGRGLPIFWPFSNEQFGFDLRLLGHFHHGGLQQGIWSVIRWDNLPAVSSELVIIGVPLMFLVWREQRMTSRAHTKDSCRS